jgi:mono/diheme cytochrome c family protein
MREHAACVLSMALALGIPWARGVDSSVLRLQTARTSPLDLEVSGELAGLPAGAVRYVTRADLLALPQVTYRVTDDANFAKPTEVSGVLLEELTRRLSNKPQTVMVSAVCDDSYEAHYPQAYLAAHHPLLVLNIDGLPPEQWPKDAAGHSAYMGPYMISHARFVPAFKILAHSDEAQIPWGVIRLEFHNEQTEFRVIAPQGPRAQDSRVQAGYRIAQQNCFRCHNMGNAGAKKAGRPWLVLSAWATASPEYFTAYVRNPKSKNPRAEMPGNPGYDDATVAALLAYFQTFQTGARP